MLRKKRTGGGIGQQPGIEDGVLIERQSFVAQHGGHQQGVAHSLEEDRKIETRGEPLIEGKIEEGSGAFDGRVILAVFHQSYHRGFIAFAMNLSADRVSALEETIGESLVDNDDQRRVGGIAFGEVAAIEQVDAEEVEVTGRDRGAMALSDLSNRRSCS